MKLSTCMTKYAPTFSYGQELYVVAERMRLQAAGMGFLQRVTGLSLRESSVVQERLRAELLFLQ